MPDNAIVQVLQKARALGASDVHIAANEPAGVRLHGRITRPWPVQKIFGDQIRGFVSDTLDEETRVRLHNDGAASASLDGDEQFGPVRVHAYQQLTGVTLALRLLAMTIAEFTTLGLPKVLLDVAAQESGLILTVGPTGSGKTTTQASLNQWILNEFEKTLITLEDPIEYRFRPGRGIVRQSEVGPTGHFKSFPEGLRSILRSDPDAVLVGECRDTATMAAMLELAEGGRLVFTSVHARDASNVFDRVIGAFPAEAQPQIRVQLAASITAVIVLRLLPRADGAGRVPAAEILVANDAIRGMVRDSDAVQIRNAIVTGRQFGMQTLESDLNRLLKDGVISEDVARRASIRPNEIGAAAGSATIFHREPATVRPMFGG